MRFELAVEAYHQLMSMGVAEEVRTSVHLAMSELAEQFPSLVVVNEARGLCEKALKLKTAKKRLVLLDRARQMLNEGLAKNPPSFQSIQNAADELRAQIERLEAFTT
jgi:hypothetical protein